MKKLFLIFILLFYLVPVTKAGISTAPLRYSSQVFSRGYYEKVDLESGRLWWEGPHDDNIYHIEGDRKFVIIKNYIVIVTDAYGDRGDRDDTLFIFNRLTGEEVNRIDFEDKNIDWILTKGDFLFIGFISGFGIYDIRNLPDISLIKIWEIQNGTVFIKDDYLFISGYEVVGTIECDNTTYYKSDLIIKIYNIKDPYNVFPIGEYKKPNSMFASKIEGKGDFIYFAAIIYSDDYCSFYNKIGFFVVDITDPSNIKEVGEYDLGVISAFATIALNFTIKNNYLYALTDDKFTIFNISNPEKIKEEGSYNLDFKSYPTGNISGPAFQIEGNYALIIENVFVETVCVASFYFHFLHILDITNPENIKLFDIVQFPGEGSFSTLSREFLNMKILNNYLYKRSVYPFG